MHALRPARGVRMPVLSGALTGAPFARALAAVLAWRERGRERAALRTLDDRALRDIGLSRAEIWREVEKPFWRA
jgi:uncharacterized protein YjiS (DUF1127 family)